MPLTPDPLNAWLSRLASPDCSESAAIAAYPFNGIGLDDHSALIWPLLYHRFPTDSWHKQIAHFFNQEFINQKSDAWLLEDTLVSILRAIPVLKLLAPHQTTTLSNQYPDALLAADLDAVYGLLNSGTINNHRDRYFKIVLAREIPDTDLVGETLHLLETDEWGDLPFPLSSILEIFDAAANDPRTTAGSIAETTLAAAALETGISSQLSKQLASSDYKVALGASQLVEKLALLTQDNRFVSLYILGLFDPETIASPGTDCWQKLRDVAVLMNSVLTVDVRTLWMRATNAVGDSSRARLSCWCRMSGVSHRAGKKTALDDLWKFIQPTWRDQLPLWEALGLSGADWIDAGAALRDTATDVAVSKLPDDLAQN